MTKFRTRILSEPAPLAAIRREWADLVERADQATPFQAPEWLISWVEAFRPGWLRTIEVRRDNVLVGLVPLLVYPRDGERVLAFAGGGVSDYLDVILDRRWEEQVWQEIVDALTAIADWTTLELTDLNSHSALLRTPFRLFAGEHDRCSGLALPRRPEELWQGLSRHQRANLRNARSRLTNAGGAGIERASKETLPEFLEDLFRLHTGRWALSDQAGMLASESVRWFHRRAAPLLAERGRLRMDRLRLKNRTLAAVYSLVAGERVFCYLQGFDPDFAYFSPGTQLMFHLLEDAIKERRTRFDLLRGQEAYKRHWGAEAESTYCIRLSRSELSNSFNALRAGKDYRKILTGP
jgi:CelD/BcsL family acetyltransferase involved in cellulose biosynthesis